MEEDTVPYHRIPWLDEPGYGTPTETLRGFEKHYWPRILKIAGLDLYPNYVCCVRCETYIGYTDEFPKACYEEQGGCGRVYPYPDPKTEEEWDANETRLDKGWTHTSRILKAAFVVADQDSIDPDYFMDLTEEYAIGATPVTPPSPFVKKAGEVE